MSRLPFLLACAALVAGCSSGASSDDAAKSTAAAVPQKTVLDPELQALQKAKDVQKTIDDGAKATDKAIDDQSGG